MITCFSTGGVDLSEDIVAASFGLGGDGLVLLLLTGDSTAEMIADWTG
jgi:hypothetical protein